MNCLSEAVKRGSEMRARQFEVGNERCPFSFERHRGSASQTPPPLICQHAHFASASLCCVCLALHRRKREQETVSHIDLEMKYQSRLVKRR